MHWGNNDPLIHLYRPKKKKKKKNERTRKDELFLQIFFKRNMINVLHHSEAVYERNSYEWKLRRRAPNKVSSVRVRHALTERRVTLSRRIARKRNRFLAVSSRTRIETRAIVSRLATRIPLTHSRHGKTIFCQ